MKKLKLAIGTVVISQVIPLLSCPELIFHYKNLVIIVANSCIWLFQPAVSAKETEANKSNDRYSVLLIISMSLISTITPIIDWAYFSDPYKSNTIATIVGFILVWSGVILRNYSVKLLGRHFTPTIQLQKNHQLITSGPYSVIRHPSYTGALLALVGSAVFFNSLVGAITAIVAMSIAYAVRINAEEKALTSMFGHSYHNYQKKTKKLIPFFW